MSTFVHVDQPLSHPGVARAEQVIGYVQEQRRELRGTRGLKVVVLAAVVAALAAGANHFVTHWTDSSLMAAWLVLWLVAFLAMALFAGALRDVASRGVAAFGAMQRRVAVARADAKFLDTARHDPRVMNDLLAAMTRAQPDVPAAPVAAKAAAAAPMPTVYEAMRRLNSSRYY